MSKFRFFMIDHLGSMWTYFFAKFLEILTTGLLEIDNLTTAKAISLNFSSNCSCTAFYWVLLILKNPRIAEFFASLPFLTYLCYKRLKAINTLRSVTKKNSKDRAGIEHIKWSLYQQHVCFCNPCARAESHQQEHWQKLSLATLSSLIVIPLSSLKNYSNCKHHKLQKYHLFRHWLTQKLLCTISRRSSPDHLRKVQ